MNVFPIVAIAVVDDTDTLGVMYEFMLITLEACPVLPLLSVAVAVNVYVPLE